MRFGEEKLDGLEKQGTRRNTISFKEVYLERQQEKIGSSTMTTVIMTALTKKYPNSMPPLGLGKSN